ncbi:MAG: SurA N-terminal domain-containing protein [Clostridia bacterium]|nr:SurA N-terminal domain-containing protein [Clostridia bacterium]
MKKILTIALIFVFLQGYSQSIKKANKYLDAGEFQNAETEFNLVREKDSLNPELWLGYALLYSNGKYNPHDFFKAYAFVHKSRDLYFALDTKGKNKLSKSYSLDSVLQYKSIIDQKLFNYLKLTDDITLYEKYLIDCKNGVYVKQITELRNENAFNTAARLNTIEAYKEFIANYPGASQIPIAVTKRDQLAFKQTIEKNTIQAYDEYLTEYKYSTYVNTAVGLKNELLFLDLLDSLSKDSINAFIGLIQQQNPKPQYLINYSNKLLKILDAQNDWIIYLSDSNLYKMNQVDYKTTQLTTSGDVLSFAISPKGDMAYLKKKDEKTLEVYSFNTNGVNNKICDYKIKNDYQTFDNSFNSFSIDNDFAYIRFGLGRSIESEALHCLWEQKENKWEECYYGECGFDFNFLNPYRNYTHKVNDASKDRFYTSKINGAYELCYRYGNENVQISNVKSRSNRINFDIKNNKIFMVVLSDCGDLCYGSFYIVNFDGTYQQKLYDSKIYPDYHAWNYNGDLLFLYNNHESGYQNQSLCLFYGYENNKKVLAKNVDMFRSIRIPQNEKPKLSKFDILQLLDYKSEYDISGIEMDMYDKSKNNSNETQSNTTPNVNYDETYRAEFYFAKDSFDLALNGNNSFKGFLQITNDYKNTTFGNLAYYYAGVCYIHKREFENAIKMLKSFKSEDPFLNPLSLSLIADSYLELGNIEMALTYYNNALNVAKNNYLSPMLLFKTALVYENIGNFDRANELFSKIETEYYGSNEQRIIEKYICRLKYFSKISNINNNLIPKNIKRDSNENTSEPENNNIAIINSKSIPISDYLALYISHKKFLEISNPTNFSDSISILQLQKQSWNDLLNKHIIYPIIHSTGIQICASELNNMIYGDNIHTIIIQNFSNPKTGHLDKSLVRNYFNNIENNKEIRCITDYFTTLIKNDLLVNKYLSLVSNGIYTPALIAEKDYINNYKKVSFEYIFLSYKDIPDKDITLFDYEIQDYYNQNYYKFKDNSKRTKSIEEVESLIKNYIVKDKKAEILNKVFINEIENESNFDNIAAKCNGTKGKIDEVSFNTFALKDLGIEPQLTSIATSMPLNEISQPIIGNNGVYIIKITDIKNPQKKNDFSNEQDIINKKHEATISYKAIESLIEEAEIIDNRVYWIE